ncbi:hypothetical protein DXB63_00875 [Bacteroides sp. OM05-12]|nr:hypothetical protein DXB63_00875 [Bacteroides sp. OM05-12]
MFVREAEEKTRERSDRSMSGAGAKPRRRDGGRSPSGKESEANVKGIAQGIHTVRESMGRNYCRIQWGFIRQGKAQPSEKRRGLTPARPPAGRRGEKCAGRTPAHGRKSNKGRERAQPLPRAKNNVRPLPEASAEHRARGAKSNKAHNCMSQTLLKIDRLTKDAARAP